VTAPSRSPCTRERRCSSAGIVCGVEDRDCQSGAIARGLEIACETVDPHTYLYCPPGAEQRDSPVVWLLLGVAVFVAMVGVTIGWLVFGRKKKSAG
jgi:hypothetical protein